MTISSQVVLRGILAFVIVFVSHERLCARQPVTSETQSPHAAWQDLPSSQLQKQVETLVEALDSPLLGQRQQAEQKLLQLGPVILPLLPPEDQVASAEARQRLAQIRWTLQRQAALASLRGTKITLPGKTMLALEALNFAEKQSQNKILIPETIRSRLAKQQIVFPAQELDFWQTIDLVAQQAALSLDFFAAHSAIAFHGRPPAPPTARNVKYIGPFRIEVEKLLLSRNYRFPQESTLTAELLLAWEPRLRPIVFTVPLEKWRMTLNDGQTTLPIVQQGTLRIPIQANAAAVQLPISAQIAPQLERLAEYPAVNLRGTAKVLLAAWPSQFRFQNLPQATGCTQRVADATITVAQIQIEKGFCDCLIRLRYDNPREVFESHLSGLLPVRAWLETVDGKRLEPEQTTLALETPRDIGILYRFVATADEAKSATLVCQAPALVAETELQFAFENIRLF